MKRLLCFLLMFVCAFSVCFAENANDLYYDDETGVGFPIHDGWVEVPVVDGNPSIKIIYAFSSDLAAQVSFARMDVWSSNNLALSGLKREQIGFSFLENEYAAALNGFENAESKEIRTFGDIKYYVIKYPLVREKAGLSIKFINEAAITLVNGYLLMFTYTVVNDYDLYHPVFEDFLRSITIGTNEKTGAGVAENSKQVLSKISKESNDGSNAEKVVLNKENVEEYFKISAECVSFKGRELSFDYVVEPINNSIASNDNSSADVIIKLTVDIYDSEESTDPIVQKDYTVILKRKESYSRSGKINVSLRSDEIDTIYYLVNASNAEGTIYIER